jgi:hypothetical protein
MDGGKIGETSMTIALVESLMFLRSQSEEYNNLLPIPTQMPWPAGEFYDAPLKFWIRIESQTLVPHRP